MGRLQAWRSLHTTTMALTFMFMTTAVGSQGPGGVSGTADPLIQSVMTIFVYGGLALIITTGLIQSLRRKF